MPGTQALLARYIASERASATGEYRRKMVARAICAGCGDQPDHAGDAQGNEWRWQDYLDVADAAIAAYEAVPAMIEVS